MEIQYFKSPDHFRRWLEKHHQLPEVWVGFYKKDAGKKGITYREALDEALCFGWIDGLLKGVDKLSFRRRFTPRSARSIWSRINIARVGELEKLGRMAEPGRQAFAARDPKRTGLYSFENRHLGLDAGMEKQFRTHRIAWNFFESQPPGYRRVASWWVVSAKKEETRVRRLATLIADSAAGRRIALLTRPARQK